MPCNIALHKGLGFHEGKSPRNTLWGVPYGCMKVSCERCGVVYRSFAARVVICDVIFHSNYSICCINITISSFISSRYSQWCCWADHGMQRRCNRVKFSANKSPHNGFGVDRSVTDYRHYVWIALEITSHFQDNIQNFSVVGVVEGCEELWPRWGTCAVTHPIVQCWSYYVSLLWCNHRCFSAFLV